MLQLLNFESNAKLTCSEPPVPHDQFRVNIRLSVRVVHGAAILFCICRLEFVFRTMSTHSVYPAMAEEVIASTIWRGGEEFGN